MWKPKFKQFKTVLFFAAVVVLLAAAFVSVINADFTRNVQYMTLTLFLVLLVKVDYIAGLLSEWWEAERQRRDNAIGRGLTTLAGVNGGIGRNTGSYSQADLLSFGDALDLLKSGAKVGRLGWNGKGMWLELQRPTELSKMTLPYIYMKTADNNLVPWLASQTDMLAEDWVIVE